jgi:hypothetical protein
MIANTDDKYHVAIVVPTHDMVPAHFAASLSNMIGYTQSVLGDKVLLTTQWMIGTYIHRAREQLLDEAIEIGCHYILWLDSDHKFPMDSLVRLLSHDVPMVGINYSTRGVPPRYVAIERTMSEHLEDGLGGKLLATTEEDTGLAKVEALGFGMVLMKAAIYPTLPKDGSPNFFFTHDPVDSRMHIGEDVWFCKRVRQAGWDIFVDHDLSKECTHIGQIEYRLQHVWAMKEEDQYVDYPVLGTDDSDGELAEPERSGESDS